MRLRAVTVGVLGGLVLGVIASLLIGPFRLTGIPPVPLGEDRGKITRVVMHYQPDAAPLVIPIYRQFLTAVGKDVEVVWVVGKQADLSDLKVRLSSAWPAGHYRTLVVGKAISTWSKDRFVAMYTPSRKDAAVCCAPARTCTANPLRTNDQEVPYRLAQTYNSLFGVRGSDVDFDGGDFLATSRHFFAGPTIFQKNTPEAGTRYHAPAQITDALKREMNGNITWLGSTPKEAPPHHIGMFLTVMGQRAAVGDVRLAEEEVAAHPETMKTLQVAGGPATPAFRADLQNRLDRVARKMKTLGYTVVRVPLLPSATTRAWMSYNNGIVETRGGKTIFYMPTFGARALDVAVAESFCKKMHCTVVPIDCAKVWRLGGSLHCLVNVVGRQTD